MSSHHIVREKQEPALLIAGLEAFPDELLGQLLEWSPTVVVTADTAERVQAYGIKIDWLVGGEDEGLQQSDIKILPSSGNGAVATALDELISQGYPAVNIITDGFNADDFTGYVGQIGLVIFLGEKKVITAQSGFSKWLPAGNRLEFLTLPHNFVYTGLLPVGNNVYETTNDGFINLQFKSGFVFMAEEI